MAPISSSGARPPSLKKSEAVATVCEVGHRVKYWLAQDDGVEAARPSHCAACGVAAYRPDGRLTLHGHGTRKRTLWGPRQPTGLPATWEIVARRFRCTVCNAARTVQPAGLGARLRYSLPVIALALMAWALWLWPGAQVREQLSPWHKVGATDAERWPSLRRWARRVDALFGLPAATAPTARAQALRAVFLVRARGPTDRREAEQVTIGAAVR